MKASLIIPTYNSRSLLSGCLTSLNHQSLEAVDSFEVIVIDDGSTDGTGHLVSQLDLRYDLQYRFKPRTRVSCRSAARNLGLEWARGEVIVMVDGDQIIAPDFIAEHLRYHAAHSDLVSIGCRTYLSDGETDLDALGKDFTLAALPKIADIDERAKVMAILSENLCNMATCWHFLYGCNVSVRREHMAAVGGFDERIQKWGFEDVELGYRLKSRGLTFAYNRYAVVYHQHHPASADQYGDWRENLDYFAAKHPALEVALQGILDRYFNPTRRDLTWVESYLRFEYATRALHGRLPVDGSYNLVTIDAGSLSTEPARLQQLAQQGHLLVIDRTDDRGLPLLVQTTPTPWELAYFKCASAEATTEATRRYPVQSPEQAS